MTKPNNKEKSAFDNEYDNESWSQKEINLSTKVLVALGGITSLGGIIPLIIKKFSQLNEGFSVGPGFFLIFTVTYFVGPLLILVLWSYFTNRIATPSGKSTKWWQDLISWRNWGAFKKSPVTYRYKTLIWAHIFCIIIYLSFSIYCTYVYMLLCLSPILLIAPAIGLITYASRYYAPKRITKGIVILLSCLVILIFWLGVSITYKNEITKNLTGNDKHLSNSDYEKIAYVEETSARLDHIEKDLVNEADRFFILSGMNAWNILDQQMTNFEDSVDLSAFKINQAISVFNKYVIDDDKISIDTIYDNYLLGNLYDTTKIYNCKADTIKGKKKKDKKPKFFIPHNPFCENHLDTTRDNATINTITLQVELSKNLNPLFITTTINASLLKAVVESRKSQALGSLISQKDNQISALKKSRENKGDKTPLEKKLDDEKESLAKLRDKEFDSLSEKEMNFIAEHLASEIDFKMGMVNGHIDTMLERGTHRLYPSCFNHLVIPSLILRGKKDSTILIERLSLKDGSERLLNTITANYRQNNSAFDQEKYVTHCQNQLIDTKNAYIYDTITLIESDGQKVIDNLIAIKLDDNLKRKLAATMNRYNSRILKEWMEQMYLPYAQRKTGQEIQEIAEETSWIWKEIKYMGIILSFTTLLLLALQYVELLDLKKYIVYTQLLNNGEEMSNDDKETVRTKVESLNQKANYLLFPLTTTITIVAILLIPVTTKTEFVNIEPTKSFRMLQVPSLKLPKAVESAVNIEYEERRDLEMKQFNENLEELTQELDELKEALKDLEFKRDSVGSDLTPDEFNQSQTKQTKALLEEIRFLKKQIALVRSELDKTKRR